MRLVFAGTPEFARVALERLHRAGFTIPLVLSQPDRPSGRGLQTRPSPVKAFALEHGLPLAQPRGLRLDGRHADDALLARDTLVAADVDAVVVAAYGLILPPWLLTLPRLGCLNIHASLLPRWRGAAPIQRAIEAGDAETGVTLMQMDAGLDTGDILQMRAMPIGARDTSASLLPRLADLGAEMMVGLLAAAGQGLPAARRQPQDGVTYAAKIAKAEAAIDWARPAAEIERRLRAFDPFPGARSTLAGEVLTLWQGRPVDGRPGRPGEIVAVGAEDFTVACGEGALAVTVLQRPGGRRLGAAEFNRGRAPQVGAVFDRPAPSAV